jgi:hypothetical protein
MMVVALAFVAAACGGDGDDRACRPCNTDDGCDGDQECVLAVDGAQRCFEREDATCRLGRVEVARAPTPVPTAVP